MTKLWEGSEFIYGLYFEYNDERFYFYVGRSGRGANRGPGVRFAEHKHAAKSAQTAVYTFIREELDDLGIEWKEHILDECPDDYPIDHSEFFWVVKMIEYGHKLYNEKNGDAQKFARGQEAVASGFKIDSVADVAKYKEFRKARILAEKQEMKRKILMDRMTKEDFLTKKVDRRAVIESIPKVPEEQVLEKVLVIFEDHAQEAFNCGKYSLALSWLGKSTTRFAERFGITYHECVSP